jgi:hypothetical protein
MANEFSDRDLDCMGCDPLDTYGINEDNMWRNVGVLILIGVGLRVVCCLILHWKTVRSKRL